MEGVQGEKRGPRERTPVPAMTPDGGWPKGWHLMNREQKLDYVKRKLASLEQRTEARAGKEPAGCTFETESAAPQRTEERAREEPAGCTVETESAAPIEGIMISSESIARRFHLTGARSVQLGFVSERVKGHQTEAPRANQEARTAMLPRLRGPRNVALEASDSTIPVNETEALPRLIAPCPTPRDFNRVPSSPQDAITET